MSRLIYLCICFFCKDVKDLFDLNIFGYVRKYHMLNQNYKYSMYK